MARMVFRFSWFTDWRQSVQSVLQNLCLNGTPGYGHPFSSVKSAEGHFLYLYFLSEFCFPFNA